MLADQIEETTFCTINGDAPTRMVGSCHSSPDISIVSAELVNRVNWQPMVTLATDHLPILISLERTADFIVTEKRTFINLKKGKWDEYKSFTDNQSAALPIPTDARQGERAFRKVIESASARFIPAGRIPGGGRKFSERT